MSGRQLNISVPHPEYIKTDEDAEDLLHRALRLVESDPEHLIGWDTETTAKTLPFTVGNKKPLDWMSDTVTFWSLSFKDGDQYRRWCLQRQHFIDFAPLLENPDARFACYNAKYDAHIAWNCGINVWNAHIIDGLALAWMHDENRWQKGLKVVAADWLGLHMTSFKALFGDGRDAQGKKIKEYTTSLYDLPLEHVVDYASYDAYAHLRVVEWLIEKLKATPTNKSGYNLWDHFLNMEQSITEILWRIERRGMHLDVDFIEGKIPIVEKEIEELERDINRVAGRPVNLQSPQQLSTLFFAPKKDGGMGLKPVKMTPGQKPSVDEDVMTLLDETGLEVAQKVLRCRKLYKTKSTYLTTLRDLANYYEDGRVHPSFNQFVSTGRFSTNAPNCVDGETEVLTKSGWIRFDELETRDASGTVDGSVAQWNPETKTIEFVEAELIVDNYQGKMIHIKNQHIDLLMTPNHRCPLVNRRTEEVRVYSASDYREDRKQLHAGTYICRDQSPLADLPNNHLAFLIATQADGSWHYGGIDFGFNKKRKSDRLLTLLKEIGADYSFGRNKGSSKYRFRVMAGELASWAMDILGQRRQFGSWVMSLSPKQMEFFSKEIFFWDGCWKRETMYASADKINVDWVQIILTLSGRRAKVRKYLTPEGRRDSWQLDVTNRDYSMTTNVIRSHRLWAGDVYCVRVPTGFFIVRRNGRACITGNSQNFPRPATDEFGIRLAFTAPPGYKLIISDYMQLEMRIMAHMSKDKAMIGAILDGMDIHSFTVSKMVPNVTYEEVVDAKKTEVKTDRQKWLVGLRQSMKAVGFGIIYGAGPPKVASSIDIPDVEIRRKLHDISGERRYAKKLEYKLRANPLLTNEKAWTLLARESIAHEKITDYFRAFPGVEKFMKETPQKCRWLQHNDFWGGLRYRPFNEATRKFVDDGNDYDWDIDTWEPGSKPLTRTGHTKPFGFVQTLCALP